MLFKIGVLIYGYFAGALIQAGYWMGKFNKIDIRDYGSGNAGTTNVMRTLGKKAGIATYLLDAFKAVIDTFSYSTTYCNSGNAFISVLWSWNRAWT